MLYEVITGKAERRAAWASEGLVQVQHHLVRAVRCPDVVCLEKVDVALRGEVLGQILTQRCA